MPFTKQGIFHLVIKSLHSLLGHVLTVLDTALNAGYLLTDLSEYHNRCFSAGCLVQSFHTSWPITLVYRKKKRTKILQHNKILMLQIKLIMITGMRKKYTMKEAKAARYPNQGHTQHISPCSPSFYIPVLHQYSVIFKRQLQNLTLLNIPPMI